MEPTCSSCGAAFPADAAFCPKCGKKIGDSPSTSVATQIVVYLVSFFLAPFGLGYVFKYLRGSGRKEKQIGYIALALTIAAIGVMVWSGMALIRSEQAMLNSVGF